MIKVADLIRSANYNVRQGYFTTPDVAVPVQYNHLILRMDRTNWPAPGVRIGVEVTRDNGVSWKIVLDQFIQPFVATAKQPTVTPAIIQYAWNPDVTALRANRARAFTDSPVQFLCPVSIEAYFMAQP